jgi:hypothetical protein
MSATAFYRRAGKDRKYAKCVQGSPTLIINKNFTGQIGEKSVFI